MPGGIQDSALLDLLAITLKDLPFDGNYESTTEFQRFEAVSRWFKKDRVQSDGGTSYQRNIVLTENGTARHVSPYEKLDYTQIDSQTSINVRWSIIVGYWITERHELLRNRGKAKIIPYLKAKRNEGRKSYYTTLERRAWLTPNSATDYKNPFGLPYWIVKMTSTTKATLTAGSYRGWYGYNPVYGDGTTAADCGGLDASSASTLAGASMYRNWCAAYPNATFDLGVIDEMRWAFLKMQFMPPEQLSDLAIGGKTNNFRIYTNDVTRIAYEKIANAQNDDLGSDLDSFGGNVSFRKIPITHIPPLDSDTSNPIYMPNHDHFYPVTREGEWEREDEPMRDRYQPQVFNTNTNGEYQYFCDNRREGGAVISIVA